MSASPNPDFERVMQAFNAAAAAASVTGTKCMYRALNFITANLHRKGLTADEIAQASGVSRATLFRLFAPAGGFAQILWACRVEAARLALEDLEDRRNMAAIAEAFGFSESGQFSRQFKARLGVPPSAWRIPPSHRPSLYGGR